MANADFNELALTTIQSQYAASSHIVELVTKIAARIDPTLDIKLFYDNIFNTLTATGVGLDIWARIVGVPSRYIIADGGDFFGFDESELKPFDEAPFYYEAGTSYYRLSDEAYRTLILFKAAANIRGSSAKVINDLIYALTGASNSHVVYVAPMEIKLYLAPPIDAAFVNILYAYMDIIVPSGVLWSIVLPDTSGTFGFKYSGYLPFSQGTFRHDRVIND